MNGDFIMAGFIAFMIGVVTATALIVALNALGGG